MHVACTLLQCVVDNSETCRYCSDAVKCLSADFLGFQEMAKVRNRIPEPEEKPANPSPPKFPLANSVTRRQVFAQNLDRLLTIVGLSRKDAAEELGIPYSLIRRFVTLGLSRRDERNAEYLAAICRYFCWPDIDGLWNPTLVDRLLASGQGDRFKKEFRPRLEAKRREWLSKLAEVDPRLLHLVNAALGFNSGTQSSEPFEGELAKVRVILTSEKANLFRQLIESFHEMATGPKMISLRDTDQ
jgi:hypothetical protein